jgi:hypothetical protein
MERLDPDLRQKPRQLLRQRGRGFVLGRRASDASPDLAAALIVLSDGDVDCGDVAQVRRRTGSQSGEQQIAAAHVSQCTEGFGSEPPWVSMRAVRFDGQSLFNAYNTPQFGQPNSIRWVRLDRLQARVVSVLAFRT